MHHLSGKSLYHLRQLKIVRRSLSEARDVPDFGSGPGRPGIRPFLANVNSRSRSLYAIARSSVCRLFVTLMRPTQAVQIFGNICTAFGTLAIR